MWVMLSEVGEKTSYGFALQQQAQTKIQYLKIKQIRTGKWAKKRLGPLYFGQKIKKWAV
jgi:hypothetical protein